MKKRHLLSLICLVVALLIFGAYRFYDRSITDTVAPKINIQQTDELLQVSVNDPRTALLQGVTATDARDGDVTDSVVVESVGNINSDNQVTVTYAAFDRAGNVTKAQRTVQYTDYQSPRFTLSGPLVFAYGSRFDVLEYVGAEDQLEGNIGHRVKATILDDSAITTQGSHQIQFRVTNNLGDTEEITMPVEVYSEEYPAQLTLTDYMVYIPKDTKFVARDYLKSFTALGTTTSLSSGVPEDLQLRTRGTVNTQQEGIYTISYWVSVEGGGRTFTGYSRLIVVVEG